jgi:oxygen-independent coproporphyrinogen-3 oxidase
VSLGIYIHIPFCQGRCSYCHFLSLQFHEATADRYRKSVLHEIDSFSSPLATEEVNSIYFGGGTPSLMPAEHIADLLTGCMSRFRVSEDCEISLEANPGTISADKAVLLRKAGVTRISLGAQSFSDGELSSIGRLHNSDTILQTLGQLRAAGFINLNLDLLLGLPNQTAESWRHNLEAVVRLSVPHVSVYMLDLDEQCALSEQVADGLVCLPEEDLISDLYLETIDSLAACGLVQYEISNFARPGYTCRHNLKYWTREPFHGFGLGSHSFDRQSRYANIRHMGDYFRAMDTGRSPISWKEPVTDLQALEETLFLGLRLTEGVDWGLLQRFHNDNKLTKYKASLQELATEGLIEWKDSVVRLTASGMLLSNEIFQTFV